MLFQYTTLIKDFSLHLVNYISNNPVPPEENVLWHCCFEPWTKKGYYLPARRGRKGVCPWTRKDIIPDSFGRKRICRWTKTVLSMDLKGYFTSCSWANRDMTLSVDKNGQALQLIKHTVTEQLTTSYPKHINVTEKQNFLEPSLFLVATTLSFQYCTDPYPP